MDVRDTASKKQVLSELLEQGMVLVTLDARRPGVDVPPHLRGDPQLRLNLSYRFGLPMIVDDTGVTATLTFSGAPYACKLPWDALYLVVSHVTGRPILFPAEVPAEFYPAGAEPGTAVSTASAAPARPRLEVVTRAEEAAAPVASESEAKTSKTSDPARRAHLRVVK